MKRFVIGFILMLSLVALAMQNNFPIIRQSDGDWSQKVTIRKFDDGPYTCYVAYKETLDSGPGISCVKR